MARKNSMNKISLSILVSIILTIILVSLVNVGLSIFLERPEYADYCEEFKTQEVIETRERCEDIGGRWNADGKSYPRAIGSERPIEIVGYCDRDYECRQELDEANNSYDQIRFYVFALVGFALLLLGLFYREILVQITGLAAGGILVTQGIVTNFENKTITFVSLLLILIVFGILAYRIINKD